MSSAEFIRATIVTSLAPLAAARDAHIESCAPIIPGVTHCESCGFSYRTPRHVVKHRDRCTTPGLHPLS